MKQLYRDLKGQGVEVVAITTYYGYYKGDRNLTQDQEFAKMAGYMEEWELPWPMVFSDRANFEAYGVQGIPQYVVIDRQGKVHSITVGYNEALHAQLRKNVETALRGAGE